MKIEEFKKLPKKDKDKYLFCDMAHRLIRVEQKVSASFNKPVKLEQTEYYKSLTPVEQKNIKEYVANKKKNKILCLWATFISITLFVFLRISLTGNVISNSTSYNYLYDLSTILLFVLIIFFIVVLYYLLNKRVTERHIRRHLKKLKPILSKKHLDE